MLVATIAHGAWTATGLRVTIERISPAASRMSAAIVKSTINAKDGLNDACAASWCCAARMSGAVITPDIFTALTLQSASTLQDHSLTPFRMDTASAARPHAPSRLFGPAICRLTAAARASYPSVVVGGTGC